MRTFFAVSLMTAQSCLAPFVSILLHVAATMRFVAIRFERALLLLCTIVHALSTCVFLLRFPRARGALCVHRTATSLLYRLMVVYS